MSLEQWTLDFAFFNETFISNPRGFPDIPGKDQLERLEHGGIKAEADTGPATARRDPVSINTAQTLGARRALFSLNSWGPADKAGGAEDRGRAPRAARRSEREPVGTSPGFRLRAPCTLWARTHRLALPTHSGAAGS